MRDAIELRDVLETIYQGIRFGERKRDVASGFDRGLTFLAGYLQNHEDLDMAALREGLALYADSVRRHE